MGERAESVTTSRYSLLRMLPECPLVRLVGWPATLKVLVLECAACGSGVVCEQYPRLLSGADFDCLGSGCANDAILGGCDLDQPGTGFLQTDGAGGGPLFGLLVGLDGAGSARGPASTCLEAPGRIRGGGDCVGRA